MAVRPRTLLAVFLAAASGCGGEKEPPAPSVAVVPVSGRVTVNGQPHPNLRVRFVAADPAAAVPEGESLTAPDGGFTISTFRPGDGLPPGRYSVCVTWPETMTEDPATSGDHLKGRYSNPRRPAAVADVKDQPFQLPPLNLR